MYLIDRVMIIVLKISYEVIRIIAVYLLHADYAFTYLKLIFCDNERLMMEACDKRYAVVFVGDFSLSLDQGVRDRILQDIYSELSSNIASRNALEEDLRAWTFI